jgi:2-phosphosulfolactate phosphatase
MNHLDVAFIPTELEKKSPDGTLAVLIDVVRATTTIVTALAHGCRVVYPVLTVEQAFALGSPASLPAQEPAGSRRSQGNPLPTLLGGERGGLRVEGFDLGNSPREYARDRVQDTALIFSTSNGTRTLLALKGATEIMVAAFVNISAVCDALIQACQQPTTHDTRILIACSGVANTFSLEDSVCAGMLISLLSSKLPEVSKTPSATAAEIVYHHYAENLLQMLTFSDGGRRLIPIGLEADLPVCADVDRFDIVPTFRDGAITL